MTARRGAADQRDARPVSVLRRTVPLSLVPLTVVASALAATPWLRSFPAGVLGAPLYGAAVLSVLVPVVAVAAGARRVWLALVIDLVAFVLYTLLAVLHNPIGFTDLWTGIVHGPSQILTFALPLVSPRTLLVAPIALTWLAGALAGECVTRRWFTLLPYPALLVGYGLAYGGTVRAAQSGAASSTQNELLLAALLLGVLLLLRVAQTWVRQDDTAESTQADGILPIRGLVVGSGTAIAVAVIAGLVTQASAFGGKSTTPQRVPSVLDSRPLSPVGFIASLRPTEQQAPGSPVFVVQTDRTIPGYFGIANVDTYDGDGWSFNRTFRPSGGVLPDDTDAGLKAAGESTLQQYTIESGPLDGQPWMPYVYRAQKVTGMSVNIDPDSGMIVPASRLYRGEQYRVRSQVSTTTFDKLGRTAVADTGTAAQNTAVPPGLQQYLTDAITAFSDETGVPATPALPFLQALQRDLRSRYSLTGTGASNDVPSAAPGDTGVHRLVQPPLAAPSTKPPTKAATKAAPPITPPPVTPPPVTPPASTPVPGTGGSATTPVRQGTTSLSDVLASIVLGAHTGTPEQYATLVALIARQLGVPARVATGFRVTTANGGTQLPGGRYVVTTKQAWTWVEVPISGLGWVVLDAAPDAVSNAQRQSSAAAKPSPTPSSTPTQNALITKSNAGHAIAPKSKVPKNPGASQRPLVLALIIVIAVLLLALLALLLVRKQLRRRRRRNDPDPRRRAIGAWRESIDVLSEAGLPDLTNLTADEISLLTGERFGADPAGQAGAVGRTANAAAYSTALLVGPQEAEAAWEAERILRRLVNRQLGARGRFNAWLRYHRNPHQVARPGPQSWSSATTESGGRHAAPRRRGPLRVRRRH
jgi:hypothetical protein